MTVDVSDDNTSNIIMTPEIVLVKICCQGIGDPLEFLANDLEEDDVSSLGETLDAIEDSVVSSRKEDHEVASIQDLTIALNEEESCEEPLMKEKENAGSAADDFSSIWNSLPPFEIKSLPVSLRRMLFVSGTCLIFAIMTGVIAFMLKPSPYERGNAESGDFDKTAYLRGHHSDPSSTNEDLFVDPKDVASSQFKNSIDRSTNPSKDSEDNDP